VDEIAAEVNTRGMGLRRRSRAKHFVENDDGLVIDLRERLAPYERVEESSPPVAEGTHETVPHERPHRTRPLRAK